MPLGFGLVVRQHCCGRSERIHPTDGLNLTLVYMERKIHFPANTAPPIIFIEELVQIGL